jgi:hypothetical protein
MRKEAEAAERMGLEWLRNATEEGEEYGEDDLSFLYSGLLGHDDDDDDDDTE